MKKDLNQELKKQKASYKQDLFTLAFGIFGISLTSYIAINYCPAVWPLVGVCGYTTGLALHETKKTKKKISELEKKLE